MHKNVSVSSTCSVRGRRGRERERERERERREREREREERERLNPLKRSLIGAQKQYLLLPGSGLFVQCLH